MRFEKLYPPRRPARRGWAETCINAQYLRRNRGRLVRWHGGIF